MEKPVRDSFWHFINPVCLAVGLLGMIGLIGLILEREVYYFYIGITGIGFWGITAIIASIKKSVRDTFCHFINPVCLAVGIIGFLLEREIYYFYIGITGVGFCGITGIIASIKKSAGDSFWKFINPVCLAVGIIGFLLHFEVEYFAIGITGMFFWGVVVSTVAKDVFARNDSYFIRAKRFCSSSRASAPAIFSWLESINCCSRVFLDGRSFW